MSSFVLPAIVLILLFLILLASYIKAPPNTAYIISGMSRKTRTLIGKAGFRFPFLERVDKLSLELIPVKVTTASAVPTIDFINVRVEAAVNVSVDTDPSQLNLAAQHFLNLAPDDIGAIVCEVLEGNTREIVGRMTLKEMVQDRAKFSKLVEENAGPDLEAMGIKVLNFNVQNFIDEIGVIADLGADNVSQIQKSAAIAKATAEKEIAVAKAQANRESNKARVASELEIERQNNDLELQKYELKRQSSIQNAIAESAFKIQSEEQRKISDVAAVDADIAKTERTIELKEREAEVRRQVLDAEIRAKADATAYSRQKAAEAELYERKMKAEAFKYEQELQAAGIRAKGVAEADTIRQKGLAEAEAMEKRAEAYANYGQAAIVEMVVKVLPEIAKSISEPLGKIDKISVYSGGTGDTTTSPLASMGSNVPTILAKTFDTVKDATGVDLTDVLKANTLQAKTDRNVSIKGSLDVQAQKNPDLPTMKNTSEEVLPIDKE